MVGSQGIEPASEGNSAPQRASGPTVTQDPRAFGEFGGVGSDAVRDVLPPAQEAQKIGGNGVERSNTNR